MDCKQMIQDILPIYGVNAQVEFIDDTGMLGMYLDGVVEEDEMYLVDVLQFIRDVDARKEIFGEDRIDATQTSEFREDKEVYGYYYNGPKWKFYSMQMSKMETRQEQLAYLHSFIKK